MIASDAAYIAAVVLLAIFGFIGLWLWRREIKDQAWCGAHNFAPRTDKVFRDEKWHEIYVRDVCVRCGDTRERST